MNAKEVQAAILFSEVARKKAIAAANQHSDAALAAAIAALPKALFYKGAVNYYADLPTTDVTVGDCYTVLYTGTSGTVEDGTEYAWGAIGGVNQWIPIGPNITGKANKALLAQDYSSTAAYAIDEFCLHDDKMYRCISAISMPGEEWTLAHWTETTVAAELIRASVVMVGATSSANGTAGKVPAPGINDREKYLRGDGTWANPPGGSGGATHFLAMWNCTTGKPAVDPATLPYTYNTGDYYIVGTVGETNYKPNGSTYTGAASSTAETGAVKAGWVYYYDGSAWKVESAADQNVTAPGLNVPANAVPTSDGNGGYIWMAQQGGGSVAGVVAPAYSTSATYGVDELVIYNSLLYRCISAIESPEAWTAAHWAQTTVDAELAKYMKYSSLVVTCVTQDSVTVTGQTVTVRKGSDATGTVYATRSYNGQPVSIPVPVGFDYFVSVSDTLEHHFNPTTAAGVISASTVNITLTYSDFSNINTFSDVKAALNADIDLTGLVGEQVTATRQGVSLAFDVADYDAEDHSIWLLLHNTMPNQMVFEPAQALAYFENGLAAGDYCFTHGGTGYYFTLTQAIPEGGQLRATTSSFDTYASQNSGSALEHGNVSTTAITGATSLGTTATGDLNHMDRVNYGSNNAGESGLFTWLNSSAAANTNLPRINKFSRPYSSGSDGGFLNGFAAADLACLENVTWSIQANNVYEAPASMGGIATKGQSYNIIGKIGLAKFANIGLSGSNPWDLYVGATNPDRIKYYNNGARGWWVFDASTGVARNECVVYTSGGSDNYGAYNSFGVVPACKIKKST